MGQDEKKQDEFYAKFKHNLEGVMRFPDYYTDKFIVRDDSGSQTQVEDIFKGTDAVISHKPSTGGKYTSITITLTVSSADDVISNYRRVAEIPGVIML